MLKIGELAKQAGLNPSKIRFFEKEGVFNVGKRQANGYRVYPEEAVELLNRIVQAQEVGFTLKELRSIGQNPESERNQWSVQALETAVVAKLASIKALQAKLSQNQQKLEAILEALKDNPEDSECVANAKHLLTL